MTYDERSSDGSSSSETQDSYAHLLASKPGQSQTPATAMPKHIPFPEHATTSEWLSELIMTEGVQLENGHGLSGGHSNFTGGC